MTASPELTITAPEANTRIDPTNQKVVIEVLNPGTHPARQLDALVGVTTILTWVAGTVTLIDPDFSIIVTAPAPNSLSFELDKLTPWPDPSTVALSVTYAPNPDVLPLNESSTVLSAFLNLQAANPGPQQLMNTPTSALSFVATSSATITGLTGLINGEQAFVLSGGTLTWSRPNFSGSVVNAGSLASGTVALRRGLPPNETSSAILQVQLTADFVFYVVSPLAYDFYVTTAPTFLPGISPAALTLNTPMSGFPALEAERVTLLNALSPGPQSPPLAVLAYARVLRSSLAPIAQQLDVSGVRQASQSLGGADLTDTVTAADVITNIDILWQPATQEARRLGVDALIVDAIERAYDLPYPQERIGAAALLLLAASAQFTA